MTAAEETRDHRYARQTSAQFEALGRFVQEFEQMVNAVRMNCVLLLATTREQQTLANIVLHHSTMSAGPLLEIMRSMYAEKIKDTEKSEADTIKAILKQVAADYQALIQERNRLLHGTWFIGWAHPDEADFSVLGVSKLKVTAQGLDADDLPKSVEALKDITARCGIVRDLILVLHAVFAAGRKVTNNFSKVEGRWVYKPPSSRRGLGSSRFS